MNFNSLLSFLLSRLWITSRSLFLSHPHPLGRGKRLFGDNAQASSFTLAHSTSTPSGVLITRYVRSGEVRTGTFDEVK